MAKNRNRTRKIPKYTRSTISEHEAEAICRMVEASTGEERPEGMEPVYAVMHMLDETSRQFYLRTLHAAAEYILELLAIPGQNVSLH